jgi:hypothetical protein
MISSWLNPNIIILFPCNKLLANPARPQINLTSFTAAAKLNLHFKAWGTTNSCYYSHFLLWKIHLPRSFMPSIIVIKSSLSCSQSEHQHMETTKVLHRYTLSFLESKVIHDMMQLQHTTWASPLSVLIANGGWNWWPILIPGNRNSIFCCEEDAFDAKKIQFFLFCNSTRTHRTGACDWHIKITCPSYLTCPCYVIDLKGCIHT